MGRLNKAFATEIILTVGILVASGVLLLQLQGVFYGQNKLSQEQIVYAFADDVENIVDKAVAVTGNATFVYHPAIKSYTLTVKNSTVFVYDKSIKKTASFTRTNIKLQDMVFENSEIIYIIKFEDNVYILGKCREKDESCSYSIMCCHDSPYCWGSTFVCQKGCAGLNENAADDEACCSGFLNGTSKKCDNPPFCPISRICNGAPESINIGGKDCCPVDKPRCAEKHCCPVDKPRWCQTPKTGNARCMDDAEHAGECQSINLKILIIPINWDSSFASYDSVADNFANYFLDRVPLKDCPTKFKYLKVDGSTAYGSDWKNWYCNIPVVAPDCYDSDVALETIHKCAEEYKTLTGEDYDYVIGIDDSDIAAFIGYCEFGIGGWSDGFGGLPSVISESIPSIGVHELGHEFGLADEYCDCSGTAFADYCGPTAPINPLKEELGCKAGVGQGCCKDYGSGPYDLACGWCYGNFDRLGSDTNNDGKLDSGKRSVMSNTNVDHHDVISYLHLQSLPKLKC